jgi:argininosuccinate synthase
MLQALIDKSQENVTGTVRLKLYKGNVGQSPVVGRKSPGRLQPALYSMKHVTFEDDQGAYDQRDAEGFIKLNALRLPCWSIPTRSTPWWARRARSAACSAPC